MGSCMYEHLAVWTPTQNVPATNSTSLPAVCCNDCVSDIPEMSYTLCQPCLGQVGVHGFSIVFVLYGAVVQCNLRHVSAVILHVGGWS